MTTIKKLIIEELRQKGKGYDETTVKCHIRHRLKQVFRLFPNDTDEGREFASLMMDVADSHQKLSGDAVFEAALDKLTERVMNEKDDLRSFSLLRRKITEAINSQCAG